MDTTNGDMAADGTTKFLQLWRLGKRMKGHCAKC